MTELKFGGKPSIYAHHLTVPIRPLVPDKSKSMNPIDDDNLIIHGDNLHALKALLPRYAGRVDCIYIDPPYNTGNEGWIYNDNVNSTIMQRWLEQAKEVDGEDLERHDKWLCMMWPRLHLLKDMLADDGVIFISIDDNEHHHLRVIMDEIFGPDNFLASFLWKKKGTSTNVSGASISAVADYQLAYRKSCDGGIKQRVRLRETRSYPLEDAEGHYRTEIIEKRNDGSYVRPTMQFTILGQHPRKGKRWQIGEPTARDLEKRNRLIIEDGIIHHKIYDFEDKDTRSANPTYLPKDCGSSDSANKTLTKLLGNSGFENPKPYELVKHLIGLVCDQNALILDSFAGSGTMAHAVLDLNKEDGGNRRFILVECEDYANNITAERVRRVIGAPRSAEGLGGSFTYCTLSKPLDVNEILVGKNLPDYHTLASHLLYTATGTSVSKKLKRKNKDGLFHSIGDTNYYLLYEPDLDYLRSDKAMLDEKRVARIHGTGKKAVVFGSGSHLLRRELARMGIMFCLVPDGIR